MEIQKRDEEILKAVEKWGVLGLGQISGLLFKDGAVKGERQRLFFEKVERRDYWSAGYKRLGKIEEAGLIRRVSCWTSFGSRSIYFLTAKGHGYLKRRKLAGLRGYQRTLGRKALREQRWITGVGLAFSALGWSVKSRRELGETGRFEPRKISRGKPAVPDLWVDTGATSAAFYFGTLGRDRWERYLKLWPCFQAAFPGVRIIHVGGWVYFPEHLAQYARNHGFSLIGAARTADLEEETDQYEFRGSGPQNSFRLAAPTAEKELAGVLA